MNGWNSTNKALGVKWDWPLEISPKMTGGICFLNLFEPYRTVGGAWDIGVAHGTQENHLHYCTETPSNPRMPNTTLGCLVDIVLFFFVCVFFSTTFFLGGNTTKCNMLYITYTTCFFSYNKYHESWIYTYAYNTTVYKCRVFGGSNAAFFHRENTSYLSKLVLLMVCDQWLIPQEHMN